MMKKWNMGNPRNLHKWKLPEIDPPDADPYTKIGAGSVARKLWVIQGDGTVWVTENLSDESPHWEKETNQGVIDRLNSPETKALGEWNTIELFGGHLFGLESFDIE